MKCDITSSYPCANSIELYYWFLHKMTSRTIPCEVVLYYFRHPLQLTVRVCARLSTRLIYSCSLEKLQTSYGATSITSPFKSRNKKTQLFLKIIGHTFFFFIEKIIQAATITLFLMLQSRSQNTIQSTTC